ncbi:MAG: FixH family protein [Gemmatimonadota bacterium]
MKALVAGINAAFAVLLAATVYVAAVSDEGLVEDAYYERARDYLAAKEMEEELGLTVRVPARLEEGRNRLAAVVATSSGPLRGAAAVLRAMRLSGPREDAASVLREEAPGTYAGDLVLPAAGEWLLRLTVDRGPLRAERRWLATAAAREGDGGGAGGGGRRVGGDIHSGPVKGFAGEQAVILDISPKPVRAMRDLSFSVEVPGDDGRAGPPRIDLGMPGMRMPPNRVDLRRGADGIWRGKGVIVRCGSGRRTWSATVTLPSGTRAVFTFDVAD